MSNKKLVSFRLPDALMEDLRTQADLDGISVTELVSRLLRQGLQSREEAHQTDESRVDALIHQRIVSLEEELQELKLSKPSAQSVKMTALQTLLAQSLVNSDETEIESRLTKLEEVQESNREMKTHIARIEQMMKRLVNQVKG
jgi:uncharacterized protein YicC (UPF0701 family)